MQHNYISPSAMLRYFHQYKSAQCHKYPTISNPSISTDVGKIAGLANVAYRLNSLKNSKPDNIDSSKLSVTQAMYNVSILQFNVQTLHHWCALYEIFIYKIIYILPFFQYIIKLYHAFEARFLYESTDWSFKDKNKCDDISKCLGVATLPITNFLKI